ncbi:unnamed protein product, partial [Polarella glacialis]
TISPEAGSGKDGPSEVKELSPEELKEQGNLAFKRAQFLRRTTAGTQYLDEAKAFYIQAVRRMATAKADAQSLGLVC